MCVYIYIYIVRSSRRVRPVAVIVLLPSVCPSVSPILRPVVVRPMSVRPPRSAQASSVLCPSVLSRPPRRRRSRTQFVRSP